MLPVRLYKLTAKGDDLLVHDVSQFFCFLALCLEWCRKCRCQYFSSSCFHHSYFVEVAYENLHVHKDSCINRYMNYLLNYFRNIKYFMTNKNYFHIFLNTGVYFLPLKNSFTQTFNCRSPLF